MLDQGMQAELYGRFAPRIFALCRRFTRTDDEAYDAVREIFRDLVRRWEYLSGGAAHRFLLRATARRCLVSLRHERSWLPSGKEGSAAWRGDGRFLHLTEEGWRVLDLLMDEDGGPETDGEALARDIAFHVYWNLYRPEEVATLLALPVEAVEARLETIRRRALGRRSVEPYLFR